MYRSMAEGRTVACTSCGLRIEPVKVAISRDGTLVCPTCKALVPARTRTGRGTALLSSPAALFVYLVPWFACLAILAVKPFYGGLAVFGVLLWRSLRR